jgi:acetylornithine deacetylase/succinyl-diaminopimelate desuccinylase-like protein
MASSITVQGGTQFNVIPSQVVVTLDGRLLPGFTPADALAELQAVVGDEADLQVTYFDPGSAHADMGMYDTLSEILRESDPEGISIPSMLPAVTDGRFFARLGIQNYGFLPVNLPEDFSFMSTIYAANERIPVGAVEAGTEAVYKVLRRFGGK